MSQNEKDPFPDKMKSEPAHTHDMDQKVSEWDSRSSQGEEPDCDTNKTANDGSIVLDERVLASLNDISQNGIAQSDAPQSDTYQDNMDGTLSDALDLTAFIGSFQPQVYEATVEGAYKARHKNRGVNYYANSPAMENALEASFADIILADDSLTVTALAQDMNEDVSTPTADFASSSSSSSSSPSPSSGENSGENSTKKSLDDSIENSTFPMGEDLSNLSIERILQTPHENQSFSNLDMNGMNASSVNFSVNASVTHPIHSSCVLPSFLGVETDFVETDFFSLYSEKEDAKQNIMWETSHDSIGRWGNHFFDDSMDCWADFNIDTDWVDISIYLEKGHVFEIVNRNTDKIIVIKNEQGIIVQGLILINSRVSYPVVYVMQEHIRHPACDDILSLGARFGIFALESEEPWFGPSYEPPSPVESLALQQKIQNAQTEEDFECLGVQEENEEFAKTYLEKRGFGNDETNNLISLGIKL